MSEKRAEISPEELYKLSKAKVDEILPTLPNAGSYLFYCGKELGYLMVSRQSENDEWNTFWVQQPNFDHSDIDTIIPLKKTESALICDANNVKMLLPAFKDDEETVPEHVLFIASCGVAYHEQELHDIIIDWVLAKKDSVSSESEDDKE